jgi:hypothetical protein|tara:strand:- start:1688 stop:2335 length:648 start_codon:yes stop_codon:yes gene_type:complete
MSFTLSTLKTAIQDYAESSETTFVTHLPDFIKTAEERILKAVQLDVFRKNVTGTLTASNTYLTKPTDFLAPFSVAVIDGSNNYNFLKLKDVSFIRDYTPAAATTGTPKYYADFDQNTFMLAPTPDSNYTAEVHYFYRPASLTAGSDSGTTWLSENAPNSLLFGSLVEASTYLKNETETALYQAKFAEAITLLKNLGEAEAVTDEFRSGKVAKQRI